MKGLLEGDCGGSNPLLRLASHFTQDRGEQDTGLVRAGDQGMVQEFISETRHVTARPPQSFRMDSLLQEMRDIEQSSQKNLGAVPKQAPPVAALATSGEDHHCRPVEK